MCGIIGSIGREISLDYISLLAHRGPDSKGLEVIKAFDKDIFIGHTRLSILDLSDLGKQPMYSSNSRFLISFNGEIYNHDELRKELPDTKFNGHSDTETIVNHFAEYGIETLRRLNGIFAFSIFDIQKGKLYLVRDRFGVKPLYYSLADNKFLYASEIRAIKPLLNPELKTDSLAEFLKLRYNPSPDTIYQNIYKLRPGHYLELDIRTMRLEEKAFIVRKIKVNDKANFGNALEEYGELLENAVKRQLQSDVEIGVLLSGGIDSALVTYFAQKHSNYRLKTFTVGFKENDNCNELQEARETSRILGTDHYEVIIDKNDFVGVFREVNRIVEEPLGTTSQIPMYFLIKKASEHVKVVLTGQGADEPLGGYNRYLAEKHLSKFHNLINLLKPIKVLINNEKIYRILNAYGENEIIKRFDKVYSILTEEQVKDLVGTNSNESIKKFQYLYNLLGLYENKALQAMLSIDMRASLADDLLLYTDKIAMNFSVEARVPILDYELVQFIESLPESFKIKGLQRKYIHKIFAQKVLPKEIVYRKKKGFDSPTKKWFAMEIGNKYKDLILEDKNTMKYLNKNSVDKIFTSHLSKKRNYEKQIFQIISLFNIINPIKIFIFIFIYNKY